MCLFTVKTACACVKKVALRCSNSFKLMLWCTFFRYSHTDHGHIEYFSFSLLKIITSAICIKVCNCGESRHCHKAHFLKCVNICWLIDHRTCQNTVSRSLSLLTSFAVLIWPLYRRTLVLFISRIIKKADDYFIMFTTVCWPICLSGWKKEVKHKQQSPILCFLRRVEFQKVGAVEADSSRVLFSTQ